MTEAVISYDQDLPEIPEHCAFLEPDRFLRKKAGGKDEFEIVEGRRPSRLILVNQLRLAVRTWREGAIRKHRPPRSGFSTTGLRKTIWSTGTCGDTTSGSGKQSRPSSI